MIRRETDFSARSKRNWGGEEGWGVWRINFFALWFKIQHTLKIHLQKYGKDFNQ